MIQVRALTKEHAEELRMLAIEIYRTTFQDQNSPENMENYLSEAFNSHRVLMELDEPGALFMGAFDGRNAGKMVGYSRLRNNHEVVEHLGSNSIELQRLYVHANYQGKGIANELMEAAIKEVANRKAEWLWLGVWEKNLKAQRFYERWGFEKFSEHVFWMGDDPQTDWLMKKRIAY